jgi:iron complex transport system substrate-binding protein
MRTKLVLTLIILLIFSASFLAKARLAVPTDAGLPDARRAERIISMAPSITETLFALGLGDRVVGVTDYCHYPPEARQKPSIGGYLNPNYEAIVLLRPDLVVTLAGIATRSPALEKLGLNTLTLRHTSVEGILHSIRAVAAACGASDEAERIIGDITTRLESIRRKTAGLERPSVMFVVQRASEGGGLEEVCIAGHDGHIDRIIELAGGRNVYTQGSARFPVVSLEGILKMNPQVVIDMCPILAVGRDDPEAVAADWKPYGQIAAVAAGRVHVIAADYAFVPGPRFILLVEQLARLIHPEVDWQE